MKKEVVRIPQMGEGLVEARVVSFLKQPGDTIARDEPIFEMETDKAVMAIESPVEGTLEKWEAVEGDILPIGAMVAVIITSAEVDDSPVEVIFPPVENKIDLEPVTLKQGSELVVPEGPLRNRDLSPKIRTILREKGIPLDEVPSIPKTGVNGRLTEADIDQWLSEKSAGAYYDRQLTPLKKALSYRLTRAAQQAVPASITMEIDWDAVLEAKKLVNESQSKKSVGVLDMIAWCVVKAMEKHSVFRTMWLSSNTVREYRIVNLGIAVALPDDELTTAVIVDAGQSDFFGFSDAMRKSISQSRSGYEFRDPAQVTITNMAAYGVLYAQAVVVPPSVGTLFIGAAQDKPEKNNDGSILWRKKAAVALTIDHRLVNGVGAAEFLREIVQRVNNLPKSVTDLIGQ